MALVFQSISEQDFSALWSIESQAHAHPWSPALLRSCLAKPYWGQVLLDHTQQPLGFYLFQQVLDELTLMNICIAPEHQGQGLGNHLLTQALQQAKQAKATVCFLEVRASNQAAIALYQKCGFTEDGRRKGYYPLGSEREDAILMSHTMTHQ